jgi:hypothetical protein
MAIDAVHKNSQEEELPLSNAETRGALGPNSGCVATTYQLAWEKAASNGRRGAAFGLGHGRHMTVQVVDKWPPRASRGWFLQRFELPVCVRRTTSGRKGSDKGVAHVKGVPGIL